MTLVEILLLVSLGILSYWIVKRNVGHLTKTPVWLLWLVLMAPPLLLSFWVLWLGDKATAQDFPLLGLVLLFLFCSMSSILLYHWLVQKGRIMNQKEGAQNWDLKATNQVPTPNATKFVIPNLTPDEEKSLRGCFPWSIYYLQKVDYRPQAILCRGQLKTTPEVAYQKVRENIEALFGDRFLLIFQEGSPNKPFFALVPNQNTYPWLKNQNDPDERPLLAVILLAITLFTTTMAGAEWSGISPQKLQAQPLLILPGFSYSIALLGILGLREFCNVWAAKHYKIRSTLPYFIPIPFFIGTLGVFSQKRSPTPHRQALFDMAAIGSLSALFLAIPCLIWGLSLSNPVPLVKESSPLNFNSLDPRFSLLMSVLSYLSLGHRFTQGTALDLHPLAIAGYLGALIFALNLMPVGQLDGGRIVHAMFGQRQGIFVARVTKVLMFLFALSAQEFLIWAVILFLLPGTDEPTLNDVTDLGDRRAMLGFLALGLLVIMLVPLPGTLAHFLKI